jgi:hypothetical protein
LDKKRKKEARYDVNGALKGKKEGREKWREATRIDPFPFYFLLERKRTSGIRD